MTRKRVPKLRVVVDSEDASANDGGQSSGSAPPADVVVSILADCGTFILAGEQAFWLSLEDEGVQVDDWTAPIAVRSPGFRRMLQGRWRKLTPRSAKLKEIVDACDDACWSQGRRLELVKWTRQTGTRIFQIAINAAVIVEVSAAGFVAKRNGTEAVFETPPGWRPLAWGQILAEYRVADGYMMPRFWQAVCADLPSAAEAPDGARLTQHEQAAVLLAHWFGCVTMAATTARPVLGMLGEWGSGKTTAAALIGRMFYGPDFVVSGSSAGSSERAIKDLHATMIAKPFVVKDDMNQVNGAIVDQMCQLATGVQIDASEHRETMKHASFKVQSNLVITAHTPRWAIRADLLSRMIMVRIGRAPESSLSYQERMRRADELRPGVWADTFYALCMACRSPYAWTPTTRFDDWEAWVRRVADACGWHYPVGADGTPLPCGGLNSALWKQEALRVHVATRTDEWVAAVYRVAQQIRSHADRWYTAADLYDLVSMSMGATVSGDADKRPSAFAVRSPLTLAQFLNRLEGEGSAVVRVLRGPLREGVQTWRLETVI